MKIERMIIESSVVLISIFSTVGLLIGTITQQFKDVYVYFGYMLYFSFPFIFAAMFGVISIVGVEERLKEGASAFSVSFYLTGFIVLFYLACIAAQTAALPGSFVYLIPAQNLIVIEFLLGVCLSFAQAPVIRLASAKLRFKHRIVLARTVLTVIGMMAILAGALAMGVYGVQKTERLRETEGIFLKGAPFYETESINFTLEAADQVSLTITSGNDATLHYVFLDARNYGLYKNGTTRFQANPIRFGYAKEASFLETANSSGIYYFAMESLDARGDNVAYQVVVIHFDNSGMTIGLIMVAAGFFGMLIVSKGSNAPEKIPYRI